MRTSMEERADKRREEEEKRKRDQAELLGLRTRVRSLEDDREDLRAEVERLRGLLSNAEGTLEAKREEWR